MKNRLVKLILGITVLPVSMFLFMVFIIGNIAKGDALLIQQYLETGLLIFLLFYIIYSTFLLLLYIKKEKKEHQILLTDVKNKLTSEFKPVCLKNSAEIPEEEFVCQAKRCEDGKIICKIKLNYEVELEDCEEFLDYFYFENFDYMYSKN